MLSPSNHNNGVLLNADQTGKRSLWFHLHLFALIGPHRDWWRISFFSQRQNTHHEKVFRKHGFIVIRIMNFETCINIAFGERLREGLNKVEDTVYHPHLTAIKEELRQMTSDEISSWTHIDTNPIWLIWSPQWICFSPSHTKKGKTVVELKYNLYICSKNRIHE